MTAKFSLFKNKNFLLLWSSQVLSQMSINIMNFLVLIHVYEKTNSSIAASMVWISYGMTVVVLGPILASVVELNDKRKVMLLSNVLQAFVIAVFALLYQNYLYLSFIVVALYSMLDQFYVPAETASIPVFVTDSNLTRANGLFFLSAQAAAVLGFGLSGVVMEFIGFSNTLLLAVGMLLAASVSVTFLPKVLPKEKIKFNNFEEFLKSILKETVEGFKFIFNRRRVLYPTLLLVLLQVYMVIFVVNLPAIGKEILKTKSSYVGVITILPIGFGAIVGTYFVPKLLLRLRKSILVLNSLNVTGVSMIIAPIASFLPNFWLGRSIIILCFVAVGFSFVSIIVPSITYMQTHTPDHYMARVFGNFWFAAYLATLLPTLFSASLTETLGAHTMLIIMGFILLIFFVYSKSRLEKIISTL